MTGLKKIILLVLLLGMGAMSICIYSNYHYYYRARKHEDARQKIALLERSNKSCPTNDVVFYELGKSYFDLGIESIGQPGAGEASLKKALESFKMSIRLNPANPYSHLYLGQSLLHLDLLSLVNGSAYIDEFRKAAMLAGDDHQVYREVGRLFLSRWNDLAEKDRGFTLDVLKKTMAKKDSEEIARLMVIWELNSKDYGVMEKILPRDAGVYRQYADFLGEKSLSLEERHKYLSLAEYIDFDRARRDYQLGENLLNRYRLQDAFELLKRSLDRLKGIRFYQDLHTENSIDRSEYIGLLRSVFLGLAKCRIEAGADWKDYEDYLLEYLAREDNAAKVEELKTYLQERDVLSGGTERRPGRLSRLALELLIQFKQNRYREIIGFGRSLQESFMFVPESDKAAYVRVLQLIGDSLQKVDFLYDAGDTYQKALDVQPDNLEALLKIRQNHIRLNADQKTAEIDRTIEKLVAPREIRFDRLSLDKGRTLSRSLVFEGKNIRLGLQFGEIDKDEPPIVTLFFNHRVVWEDFVREKVVSIELATQVGENLLQVVPLNRPVALAGLVYQKPSS